MDDWDPFADPAAEAWERLPDEKASSATVKADAQDACVSLVDFTDPFADPAEQRGAGWTQGIPWDSLVQTRALDCGVACLRFVVSAVRGADPGIDACDDAVGLMPGQTVMTWELAMGLGSLLQDCHAHVSYMSKFVETIVPTAEEVDEIEALRDEAAQVGVCAERKQIDMPAIIAFFESQTGRIAYPNRATSPPSGHTMFRVWRAASGFRIACRVP